MASTNRTLPKWVVRPLGSHLWISWKFLYWLLAVRVLTILEYELDNDSLALIARTAAYFLVFGGIYRWLANRAGETTFDVKSVNLVKLFGLSTVISFAYWIAETSSARSQPDTAYIIFITTTMLTFMVYFLYSQIERVGGTYRRIRAEESLLEAELAQVLGDSEQQIRGIVEEARREAATAFDNHLKSVNELANGALSSDLLDLTNQVKLQNLRPLAKRLFEQIPDWQPRQPVYLNKPFSLPKDFNVSDALRPNIFIWLAPLFVIAQIAIGGLQMLPYVLFYVLAHASLWFAARWMLRKATVETWLGIGILLVLSVVIPFLATSLEVIFAGLLYYRINLIAQVLQNTQVMPMIVLGVAYVVKVSKAVRASLEHLESLSEELALEKRSFAVRAYAVQKQFGVFLHGVVQSALSAAALRLKSSGLSPESWHEYNLQVRAAGKLLQDFRLVTVDLEGQISLLGHLWRGIAEITVEADSGLIHSIGLDQNAAYCVSEVMQETVSNAIRHGKADRILFKLGSSGDLVSLEMLNNGLDPKPSAANSLGVTILDDLCLEWCFETSTNPALPVALRATIPLMTNSPILVNDSI